MRSLILQIDHFEVLTSITSLFFFILLFCILHVALKGCMQLHTPTFICHNKPPWCYVTGQIKTYMEMNMYTCKYFLLFYFFFFNVIIFA